MENADIKYLKVLATQYPNIAAAATEIVNLKAILSLPKATEHFITDVHGEYEQFRHVMCNGSGAVQRKIEDEFGSSLGIPEKRTLATLIYYPELKIKQIEGKLTARENLEDWYKVTIFRLIRVCKNASSKYTRSKVRKSLPKDFAYIIEELMTGRPDVADQEAYYNEIINSVIHTGRAAQLIADFCYLIRRFTVDHLHVVDDIFDRGPYPHLIMDDLMKHHSVDIQWGNHDILWMGAAAGSKACIATVVRNNLKYNNTKILENSYGISLRNLALFAEKIYPSEEPMKAALKAISVMLFKLEGQVILRNPDYNMTDKLLLHKVNVEKQTVEIDGTEHAIKEEAFTTVNFDSGDIEDVYQLSEEEEQVMEGLRMAFVNSIRLRQHIDFLYQRGSMYRIFNGNLLYHGCVPLDESGNLEGVAFGKKRYHGREYLDYAERIARRAWSKDARQKDRDFMWYLWCGRKSPLSGRNIKTFERTYVLDENTWVEQSNPYYKFYHEEKICNMILHEFGLYSERSHIINGHTPVRTSKGEHPVRAEGKLLVIDGGFCKELS